MFVKQFPIKDVELEFNTTNLSKDSFKDLVEVSGKFKAQFYNAGIMMNGKVYTSKVSADCYEVFPLKKIIQHEEVDKKFFLSDEAYKKFKYLKGNKRIPRIHYRT